MMELPWIQVSFECSDGIQIPCMARTCWFVYVAIDVRYAGTCLDKKGWNSRGRDPMWVVHDYRGQSWYGL